MLRNPAFWFVVVVEIISLSSALKPPKEFVLCHRSDPDFEKCLSRAGPSTIRGVASGNTELGLPVLDFMKISRIDIEGNGGPIDLTQHYTDCVLSGASNVTYSLVQTSFEKENCYIRIKSFTGASVMTCQYAFKGKLLLLPVNGHGPCNITQLNRNGWHNMTCYIYEKDGNEYLNITDLNEDIFPEKIFYEFDNLVDGNAELSAQVLQVMNDNALEVFDNVKAGYEKVFANISKQLANNIFSKIPWRDIFLE